VNVARHRDGDGDASGVECSSAPPSLYRCQATCRKCSLAFGPSSSTHLIARPGRRDGTSLPSMVKIPAAHNRRQFPAPSPESVTELQAIIGTLLYYARAVDPSLLPIANELTSKQSQPTAAFMHAANRALSYCAGRPNMATTFHECGMILIVYVDASYLSLSRSNARSVVGCIFFLGNQNQSTRVNGTISVISTIIPCVVASAGEAEYAALFTGGPHAAGLRTILPTWDIRSRPQPSCATTLPPLA
jgi:hypothetical protein